MAVYDYRCTGCANTLTINQPIDQPLTDQQCQCGQPMQRIWATPAIAFKGTGWGKDR